MSVQFAKHYFTIHDHERIGETGILPSNKNYELINGEIIQISPIDSAGIPEALIFNLPDERLEYHTQPANGVYQVTRILKRGESLASSNIPGEVFDVATIFG